MGTNTSSTFGHEEKSIVELHTERYGQQFRTVIRLNTGEEHEAIANHPNDAERLAISRVKTALGVTGLLM